MADSFDRHAAPITRAAQARGLPRPARPHRLGLLLAALAAGSVACARHVRLMNPDTDPAGRYVCESSGACRPAENEVPSDDNPSGTTSFTMPRECQGQLHQILIIDAGSAEPEVRVTCAPPEEPIGTMGEPEAAAAPTEH